MKSFKDLRRIIDSMPRPAFLGIVTLAATGVLFAGFGSAARWRARRRVGGGHADAK